MHGAQHALAVEEEWTLDMAMAADRGHVMLNWMMGCIPAA